MSYQRQITSDYPAKCTRVEDFNPDDLTGWLEAQAKRHKLTYLLAHALDGVIWGRVAENGRLHTSYDALHNTQADGKWDTSRIEAARKTLPSLRVESLQQARLFSEQAELYVWQDGDGGWNGRLLTSVGEGQTADWLESFNEPQILWGTHGTRLEHDFTLLEDGQQGLYHAAPVALKLNDKNNGTLKQSLRLIIRHYLDYDEQGQAYIAVSRLVALKEEE
jgi:CRISPR-associated protein (TIGR03984 family)